jgi:hypothetical protein
VFDTLTSGDSVRFETCVPAYPPTDGWALTYRLIPQVVGAPIELQATGVGDKYRVSATGAQTAIWAPGQYAWASWVSRGADSYTIASGQARIAPNPRTASLALDTRSPAERRLADLQAAYDAHISSGQAAVAEYTIGGRGMKFRDLAALISAIERAKVDVLQERRAARILRGQPARQQLVTRM